MKQSRLSEPATGLYLLVVTGWQLCQETALPGLVFLLTLAGVLAGVRAGLLSTAVRDTALCFSFYLCVWTGEALSLFLPRFALRTV